MTHGKTRLSASAVVLLVFVLPSSALAKLSPHQANVLADAAFGFKGGQYGGDSIDRHFYSFAYYWDNPRGSMIGGYVEIDKSTGAAWRMLGSVCDPLTNAKFGRLRHSLGLAKLDLHKARRPSVCSS